MVTVILKQCKDHSSRGPRGTGLEKNLQPSPSNPAKAFHFPQAPGALPCSTMQCPGTCGEGLGRSLNVSTQRYFIDLVSSRQIPTWSLGTTEPHDVWKNVYQVQVETRGQLNLCPVEAMSASSSSLGYGNLILSRSVVHPALDIM